MKKYVKKNRILFLFATIAIMISNLIAVVLQFFKGDVLDNALSGQVPETIKSLTLLGVFILLEILFHFISSSCSVRFKFKCSKLLRQDFFKTILSKDYVSYTNQPSGEYIAKYTNEISVIENGYFAMLTLFRDILFKIIFVSIALFILDYRIAIITLILLTTPLYVPKLIEKRLQHAQKEQIDAFEKNLSKLNDWLKGFEVIKNYSVEAKIMKKFNSSNEFSYEKNIENGQLAVISNILTALISYISYFIILVSSIYLVVTSVFTAGDFIIAIGMIDQLSYPLIALAGIIRNLVSVKPTCQKMSDFVESGTELEDAATSEAFNGEISFNDVSFSYGDESMVIKNFSYNIKSGEKYLIKGPSGCGKTTIINLLLKYYPLTKGSIVFNDKLLFEIENPYSFITIVRQDATLFQDSLRNNLSMYNEYSDDKLCTILRAVGLDKYCSNNQLDMIVEENGTNFSGGERKRISLARALLRDKDILILDEPLANLDENVAKKIEDLLLSITNKTVIIVSHQFSKEKISQFNGVYDFEV